MTNKYQISTAIDTQYTSRMLLHLIRNSRWENVNYFFRKIAFLSIWSSLWTSRCRFEADLAVSGVFLFQAHWNRYAPHNKKT